MKIFKILYTKYMKYCEAMTSTTHSFVYSYRLKVCHKDLPHTVNRWLTLTEPNIVNSIDLITLYMTMEMKGVTYPLSEKRNSRCAIRTSQIVNRWLTHTMPNIVNSIDLITLYMSVEMKGLTYPLSEKRNSRCAIRTSQIVNRWL